MSAHLARRALAELIGTALLVFFGAGSVVAAIIAGDGRLDYAGLGVIGLAFGLVIAVVVDGFGTTSGAHVNPAVSIALAAVRRFPWRDVPAYLVAQFAGGILGALLIVAVFGRRSTEIGGVGLTALNPTAGYLRGVVAEAVATFLLLLAIMALAIDRRAPRGPAGLLIGLSVSVAIFVIGPVTGGSLNPARTFGPYVANAVFGGFTPWRQFWVYVVGPVVGAVLAVFSYVAVARPVREVPPEVPQGAEGEIEGRRVPVVDQADRSSPLDGDRTPDRNDRSAEHPRGNDEGR
ncbi:MIP/aquaporin family protein [Planosporangium sp. 12N6]|uniref:MIP/aquaporin family protein n=1 Tax=Planosporangium spinosum TaxID=3402278 RepID=UPI003CEEEFF9